MTLQFEITEKTLNLIIIGVVIVYFLIGWIIGRIKAGQRLSKLIEDPNYIPEYYKFDKEQEVFNVIAAPFMPFVYVINFLIAFGLNIVKYPLYPIFKPFPKPKDKIKEVVVDTTLAEQMKIHAEQNCIKLKEPIEFVNLDQYHNADLQPPAESSHMKIVNEMSELLPKKKFILANGQLTNRIPFTFVNLIMMTSSEKELFALDSNNKAFITSPNGSRFDINIDNKVVKIASGKYHHLLLDDKGTVWEYSYRCELRKICYVAIDIVAGDTCSFAIKKDGSVHKWGNNQYGQLDIPADLKNPIQIAVGKEFTAAINKDKSIVIWSNNFIYKSKNEYKFTQIACSEYYVVGLTEDGKVIQLYFNADMKASFRITETVLLYSIQAIKVACGPTYTIAINENACCSFWGTDAFNEIGFVSKIDKKITDINISGNNIFVTCQE